MGTPPTTPSPSLQNGAIYREKLKEGGAQYKIAERETGTKKNKRPFSLCAQPR